jgi:hypothetical protein
MVEHRPGEPLGVEIDQATLEVAKINAGAVRIHNEAHPDSEIRIGDKFKAINNVPVRSIDDIIATGQSRDLKLEIFRPKQGPRKTLQLWAGMGSKEGFSKFESPRVPRQSGVLPRESTAMHTSAHSWEALKVGSRVEVLAGINLTNDGVDYFKEGDRGTVFEVYKEEGSGQERFRMVCLRTGKRFNHGQANWQQSLRLLACPDLEVGSRLRALPGVSFSNRSGEYFQEGDVGVVTEFYRGLSNADDGKTKHGSEDEPQERFHVRWERSGKQNSYPSQTWMKIFELLQE